MNSSWYPKKSRADELTKRLNRLESSFAVGLDAGPDRLSHLSQRLTQALHRRDFPGTQVSRWLWLASQYRLYADVEPKIAALAAAALVFLEEALVREWLDDEQRSDLNWVLESSVAKLATLVGPANIRGCLSDDELARIEERLSRFEDSAHRDIRGVVEAARPQLDVINKFASLCDWTSLSAKAEVLIAAAERPGTENSAARAALSYIAEVHDVVEDNIGVLGLIDDIYVLEWAYAAVSDQTLCLPILEAMSRRYPLVATLGLGAHGSHLDRFGRYIVCASLETLSTADAGTLVLREVGPYPIVAAVAAAVEAARVQAGTFDQEMGIWPLGCPITIGDGAITFRARWGGRSPEPGRSRFRLRVAYSGVIEVGEEILPYLARAQRDWKRLTNGGRILTWLKDSNVDGLVGLTGKGRRRPSRYEAVLLVTSRTKLDLYLSTMRLQGLPPAALLGACWFDSYGETHPLIGSSTDYPLLYACGDVSAACDLVSSPPDHIVGWKIVVDGARTARTLHAALSASGALQEARICFFAELHDSESASGLIAQGVKDFWYLEDQDVEVPPTTPTGKFAEVDPLARFFVRRSSHWAAAYSIRVGEDPFLDDVAECLRRGNSRDVNDAALDALDLSVSAFLRRAIAHPLRDDEDRRGLEKLASIIFSQASMLAVYEMHAAEIRNLFGKYSTEIGSGDKRNAILDLASSFSAEESIAVVCRSIAAAETCRRVAAKIDIPGNLEWTTIEGLRTSAPYDRVVVPGWLGRHTMRELSNVGFGARTDMLLLPFERLWYEKTISAARRWEYRLERETARRLKRIIDDRFEDYAPRWRVQASRRVEFEAPNDVAPIDDTPELTKTEFRVIGGIQRALPSAADRSETTKAQLVLFDEPGSFALLPPAGQIIVLPDDTTVRGDAERRLSVPVSSLMPGMLTALPLETDRDLVDAWADRILDDGGALRARADRWKAALKRHFVISAESYASFARRLGDAGEHRDALTVRAWANDTRSVAPRSYRRMLPLMAELTGDRELRSSIDDTITAIDGVYRARAAAAEAIEYEIFSGALDLTQPTISFDVDGRRVTYALARIERLAGVQEVATELLGRRLRLADLPTRDGAAA